MNSNFLDYPIHKLQEIPAEEIPNALSQIHPIQPGFQIQGTDAILISKSWLDYLQDTDLEERFNDLLHRVLDKKEDPTSVLEFILLRLDSLNFRCIRRIAGSVRFTLEFLKTDIDNTPWGSFLKQLDNTANKMERIYYSISHIDWVIPGSDYSLILFCRDQKLRFLDVSPLMDQLPFRKIKDPSTFRQVTAYYGALTWFLDDGKSEIDIDPDWCYTNGIEVDLFDLAKAIRKENPVNSMDLSSIQAPHLFIEICTHISEPETLDPEFLELWLPDPAAEDYPIAPKRYYGNAEDMKIYMEAASKCSWSALHQKRLAAYQQYCDGNTQAQVEWLRLPAPLFTRRKVEYQQQVCLEDVHWLHVDHHNRLVPLRARKILLDQVILEMNDEFIYCVRPTFEGLEQADYSLARWMPVTREAFDIANAIENRDGKFVSLLYMEAGRYKTLCLAITAMENPPQLNLRAVMDEFFGDFVF